MKRTLLAGLLLGASACVVGRSVPVGAAGAARFAPKTKPEEPAGVEAIEAALGK